VGAGFKALRQGEVTQYTALLEDSRRHAIDRLVENARLLGANAVVAMRFDSSELGQQLTEIVAYGTAVVTRPARPGGPAAAATGRRRCRARAGCRRRNGSATRPRR